MNSIKEQTLHTCYKDNLKNTIQPKTEKDYILHDSIHSKFLYKANL